ncbi:hypothetical protein UA08_04112 [Talaromyces atroroseus]|uniref:Prolyl 4-hydroxylase alpha subunit domain-containing protein n=1 Tax=Talaromyces atroroseus TaxID=1441469 RepID=A0A1Q5Q8F4_TALAT|nr:hypothetical protein UA08_04112 [Talaromyces atroroseus]OKL60342.1 hypothetical protein UA08_04112 [Talaromyces atroroseus]
MPPTTSNPSFSTILTWLFYLVPIYLFLLAPGLRILFPSFSSSPTAQSTGRKDGANSLEAFGEYFEDYDNLLPGLNTTDDSFISPEDPELLAQLDCRDDDYRVHIFSRSPLIIYIEDFFTDAEADHLVAVSESKWSPSSIYDGISERIDPSIRHSDRALLDRDAVVRCAEERARSFQGWRPFLYIERMWSQRYNTSGHYRHHYDWTGMAAHRGGGDRMSTFMVYLDGNCTGGGTNFPHLRKPGERKKWCRFIECDDDDGKYQGVTFKPIKGNAIFWENLRADGSGYPETWHAALPVLSGSKVGLNIWSWYQPPVRKAA